MKYGNEYVCKIGTFGTLGAKAVLKDVARVLKYPFDKINALTRQVTDVSTNLKKIFEDYPEFKSTYDEDDDFKRIIEIAKRLEGLQRHTSQHAAGVVISPFPLVELVPLKGNILDLTSQWEMGDIELLGFVKMDFLRLRTLTVIKDTLRSIEKNTGEEIDIDRISLTDEAVYAEFHNGNSLGIFQFESDGMQALLKKHKPKNIEDLTADNALYRPGPMDARVDDEQSPHFGKTMMEVYVERASGISEVSYDHPLLEQVQSDTYGVFVYQEQIMSGAVTLAGYSMSEADSLRKVVGKKMMDKIPAEREKFIAGCMNNSRFLSGCTEIGKEPLSVADTIFNQIATFGRYGFNKSHSTAYSDLAYRAMWLKVHYGVHFMASVLTSWLGKKVELMIPYLNECRRMGIAILPPDINQSSNKFEVSKDSKGIHFGLTGIKGVGAKAVESILELKQKHVINSLVDFITMTGSSVNRTVTASLIRCGAFDFLGYNRRTLLKMAEELIEINSKVKQKITANKKRKNPVSDISSFYEILFAYEPEIVGEFETKELCEMEKELTGFYMKHHPLDGLVEYIRSKATNTSIEINKGIKQEIIAPVELDDEDNPVPLILDEEEIEEEDLYHPIPKGRMVITGGVIKELHEISIKSGRNKGDKMVSFVIEDAYQGDIKCTAFANEYKKYKNTIRDGNVIFIRGTIDYYRDEAQVNLKEASEINREAAKKYSNFSYQEATRRMIVDIDEQIAMIEETFGLLLDDSWEASDLISLDTFTQELIVLYDRKELLLQELREAIVA